MSFRFSAAHSSKIKKSTRPRSSGAFSSLPRRKPGAKVTSSKAAKPADEDEDLFEDRLDDVGLVQALASDLTLRDVAQAIMYIRGRMWSPMPSQRAGMNSRRIAEVLNFREQLPPIVTVSHVQALLNSPTTVEREIAELIRGGALRKIVVGGRGSIGEVLILVRDLEGMVEAGRLEEGVRERFLRILRERPTAMKISRSEIAAEDAKALIHTGFLTSSTPTWTSTEVFSTPGEGSRGTMTSLNSISRAASGTLAAVGGEGAVHAAGGSGGGIGPPGSGEFSLAIPGTGAYLRLVAEARAHLRSLLSKLKFREAPESTLRERWEGGVAGDDEQSEARRNRGEAVGVPPGRTRRWKQFHGVTFEWVLGECVGAGLVEVFETGSVGRGVRAL